MISLLMSVVAAAFGLTRTSNVPLLHKDEVLSLCTAHVPLAWQLYFAGGIQEVTQTLPDYLTQLSALAQAPAKHQLAAANLVAQAYQLDPHFSYVPVNHFTLANHTSLAYLHLSQPKQAWEALVQVDKMLPVAFIPKRVELSSRQAAVSFALGDLEQTCSYFEVAALSAKQLGSDLRYNEVCETYEQMQVAWSHESRVKALAELLH